MIVRTLCQRHAVRFADLMTIPGPEVTTTQASPTLDTHDHVEDEPVPIALNEDSVRSTDVNARRSSRITHKLQGVPKVSPHCCQFYTFKLGVKLSRMKRYRNYLYSGLCLRYCGYLHTQFQTCPPHIRSVCTDQAISCYRFRPIGRGTWYEISLTMQYYSSSVRFILLSWVYQQRKTSAQGFCDGAFDSH